MTPLFPGFYFAYSRTANAKFSGEIFCLFALFCSLKNIYCLVVCKFCSFTEFAPSIRAEAGGPRVPGIFSKSYILKVLWAVVLFIPVFVVYAKPRWLSTVKGACDQIVNITHPTFVVFPKANNQVSNCRDGLLFRRFSSNAPNPSLVTNFVEPFPRGTRPPYFDHFNPLFMSKQIYHNKMARAYAEIVNTA